MALTPEQKSSKLFKKMLGAAETLLVRDFFEEPKLGRTFILPSQIWAEEYRIPITAPILSNGQTSGVVQYFEKLSLTHIAGSTNLAYYHDNLKDAIPFNFGDGTYNYKIYKSDGTTQIPFGDGDWIIDTEAGVLTFYGTLPSGVNATDPPMISFYKYVGEKGIGSGGGSFVVKDPVELATTPSDVLSNYDYDLSGFTSIPDSIDGVSGSTFLEEDRILVKNQVDPIQNGIFQVSGTTLVRALDSDGSHFGEVAINDYVFVFNGNDNGNSSWILSQTDATDPTDIKPGQESQIWKLFSESRVYTADGQAIQLFNSEFRIILDESDVGSGLEQSTDGLRVTRELIEVITGLTSLESVVVSGFISLEQVITNVVDTDIQSLEEALSGHTHYQLYTPDGSAVVAYTDEQGKLHIDGDIIQSGDTYETHIEQLYTEKDHIILRDGAISGLQDSTSISGLTGLIAENFDGSGDKGLLVFDSGGTARVGHWDGTEPVDLDGIQPLATRVENPTDQYFAYWDSSNKRLDFKAVEISQIGVIGEAEDPAGYVDGLFTDFTTGTTIGTAIDRFNEILLLLAPTPPSDFDTATLTINSTSYSSRQLVSGNSVNITTNNKPIFTVQVPTNGLSDATSGTLTFDVDSTVYETYNIVGDTSKTSAVIQFTAGDPYFGQSGKAGFWSGFTAMTANLSGETLYPDTNIQTATYDHSTKGFLQTTFYLDSPLSVTISGLTGTVPSMTSYISGVPTLTTSDTVTNISFNIENVSSYFYAPTYVWEIYGTLINNKTGDPDAIPQTPNETGSVISESVGIASGQFSDTSFTLSVRGRNSIGTNGTASTLTDNTKRVDTISNETIRKTSGSGTYPATGWGDTYDSTASLLVGNYVNELQLKQGRYQYPTVNYTSFGGPDYSTATGVRWVTFTTLGTFNNHSAFTLNFIGSNGITAIEQSGLYVEVKISGQTYWVDGNASYSGTGNPGSTVDGTAAVVYGSSTATSRRITFGSITYSGAIVVRVGLAQGSSIYFTGLTATNLV